MDEKTKELIAIGASAAVNCHPCLRYHLDKCEGLEIGRDDIVAAVEVGMMVNRGAANKTRAFSAELLGEPTAGRAGNGAATAGCCG